MDIIDNPVSVLCEMYRVLKPGGRIYLNGPDVDTWTFDASDRFVTRKILRYFCDHKVNGWIGKQMRRFFADLGFADVVALPHTEFIPDYKIMSDLYLSEVVERRVMP